MGRSFTSRSNSLGAEIVGGDGGGKPGAELGNNDISFNIPLVWHQRLLLDHSSRNLQMRQ